MRKTNKKTLFNITSVLLMTLLLIYLFTTNIYASITPSYYKPTSGGGSQKLFSKAGEVLGAVQLIGSIVSAVTLAIIGIKYFIDCLKLRFIKLAPNKTMFPVCALANTSPLPMNEYESKIPPASAKRRAIGIDSDI